MSIGFGHVLSIFLVLACTIHPAQTQEVQRLDVHERGLVGHFYAGVGASRRTGVLMLGGSGGSYPDEAAARDLARAGFPVLALGRRRDIRCSLRLPSRVYPVHGSSRSRDGSKADC